MGQRRKGFYVGQGKENSCCSLYPHEPRRPRFASFERMNMVSKNAHGELYSLQVAETLNDFLGVHNKPSICGLMATIRL